MTWLPVILIIVMALGASFIQRVTGFGFGIFIMTVLPYLMPSYAQATALSGMLAAFPVLITAFQTRKYLDIRKFWVIMLVFLLVSFFFVRIVSSTDEKILKHILGGALIITSVYFFSLKDKIHLRPTIPVQLGTGVLSAAMGGLFAMQGPPAVIYFLSCTGSKEEYLAMTSWYFVIGNIVMTAYRWHSGFVTSEVILRFLLCIPAILLGLWLGAKVFDRIPAKLLHRIIYAYMAVAGVLALLS